MGQGHSRYETEIKVSDGEETFDHNTRKRAARAFEVGAGGRFALFSRGSPAIEIIEHAQEMAREVAFEQVDVRDTVWAPRDSPLLSLLGCEEDDVIPTLVELAQQVAEILVEEEIIQLAPMPVKIYGDIRGQFRDFLLLLLDFGFPSSSGPSFVFNGDWVDHGAHQLEVVALVFAFKLAFPARVFLNRGNHEFAGVNREMGAVGFEAACARLGPGGEQVFAAFQEAFSYLPLGCVAGGAVLVVHGGIGRGDWTLEDVEEYERPLGDEQLWEDELLLNLLWSDPQSDSQGRATQHAGFVKEWSADVTETFCEEHGIAMIVRSHDCEDTHGFAIMHGDRLARVFSARDYDGHRNDGSVLFIEDTYSGLSVRAQTLRSVSKPEAVEVTTGAKKEGTAAKARSGHALL